MSYRGSQERNRRLKKLYEQTRHQIGGGAYYSERKKSYVKYSASDSIRITKYLRRQSNRKVRKSNELANGNQYRKHYDYWWIIT